MIASGTCQFGYSSKGNAYCAAFFGDGYGPKLFAVVEQWIKTTDIRNCNIDIAYKEACVASQWTKSKAAQYAYYSFM